MSKTIKPATAAGFIVLKTIVYLLVQNSNYLLEDFRRLACIFQSGN
jgi:hypothetical protein